MPDDLPSIIRLNHEFTDQVYIDDVPACKNYINFSEDIYAGMYLLFTQVHGFLIIAQVFSYFQ